MKTQIGDIEKQLKARGFAVRVEYEYDDTRKPVSCTAYVFQVTEPAEGGEEQHELVSEGHSYCHPKDNFWKKKGRHMAVCRAAKQMGAV